MRSANVSTHFKELAKPTEEIPGACVVSTDLDFAMLSAIGPAVIRDIHQVVTGKCLLIKSLCRPPMQNYLL